MFPMTANPKTSVPRRDEATRQSVPTPDGKKAESLPAPPDLSSKEEARAWNSEKRQDEVLLVAGKLLNQVLSMPQWTQQMDLAKLAVEIARGQPDTTPRSCIREARELMLAAADEMEWMRHGKAEEERCQREEQVDRELKEASAVPLPAEWAELVPWEMLCYAERHVEPDPVVFPDGVEYKAYSRANKLKELIEKWFSKNPEYDEWIIEKLEKSDIGEMITRNWGNRPAGNVDKFMDKARKGLLTKFDVYPLALLKAKKGSGNQMSSSRGVNFPLE